MRWHPPPSERSLASWQRTGAKGHSEPSAANHEHAIFIVWWDTVNVCVVHFDETVLACPTDVVTEWYEDAFLGNTPEIGRYGPGNCGISQEDAATVAEYVFSNSELDRILF